MEPAINLVKSIGNVLLQHNLFIATAESCTGGLIGHKITSLPGSSAFFLGGHIVYSNAAKTRFLGVAEETLLTHGAVSEQTVRAMADGVRTSFAGEIDRDRIVGIAVSGIAGPGGGSAEKPVGTVWIGISFANQVVAHRFLFDGDRDFIKNQAADHALRLTLDALNK